jgi:hypothetical protein
LAGSTEAASLAAICRAPHQWLVCQRFRALRALYDLHMADPLILLEANDYVLEHGVCAVMTEAGLKAMTKAHAAGRDVVIRVDELVVFRLPAVG